MTNLGCITPGTVVYIGHDLANMVYDLSPREPFFFYDNDPIVDALIAICHDIDARCLAAQQIGKELAERHRRANAQRFRKLARDLSANFEKVGSGGKSSLPSIHGDEIARTS